MKTFFALLLCLMLSTATLSSQDRSKIANNQETKGACSPIAPNNSGSITITCTGFSEQQNKQLLNFLHQLSGEQARDQDAILKKLDEIMAAVREAEHKASPRTVSDEEQRNILRSSWAACVQAPVLVIAPSGDDEAGALAIRLRQLFENAGRPSTVVYSNIQKAQTAKTDIIVANTPRDVCVPWYLTAWPLHISVGVENGDDGNTKRGCDGEPFPLPNDPQVTRVFVCSR